MITRGFGTHSNELLITRGLGKISAGWVPLHQVYEHYCLRTFNEENYSLRKRGGP